MNSISNLTAQQLRTAAGLKEKMEALEHELEQLLGQPGERPFTASLRRRRVSAEGIANIRAGVRKRWAGSVKASKAGKPGKRGKRKISAAGRAAISAAAKARWAKAKAAGRRRL